MTLTEQIIEVLKTVPISRDSDLTLTIEIWKKYYRQCLYWKPNGTPFIELIKLYELPRHDNVKRIRAKLSEEAMRRVESGKILGDEEFYFPTNQAVARARQINEAIWQKMLGYKKKPLNQTTQLPRPVGKNGFSVIDDHHYIAQGNDGKKYNVILSGGSYSNPDGLATCECESYKYSSIPKTCKHIKAAINYKKELEKRSITKKQSALFR